MSRTNQIKRLFFLLLMLSALLVWGCGNDDAANPVSSGDGSSSQPPNNKIGFGVSGLLFENNLIMWFRENQGQRSELFPQMYFTRADANDFPVWDSFPEQSVLSGGVARDGIPALVNPSFVGTNSQEIGYLRDSDLVLGAVINGEAKAYPQNILWWHEVANDGIGGVGVIMTFCPLTGTGLLFREPVNGNTIDRLELLPVVETTWKKWKELYPNTSVISERTGFDRNYTVYPYGNYRNEQTNPLFPLQTASIDQRFPPKHTVLGLVIREVQKAYPFARLEGRTVVNDEVNNQPVLIVSDLASRLAIPYSRRIDNQFLSFSASGESPFRMKDNETGSEWNIKGEAISGPLAGRKLPQIPAHNAFWFAWAAFWPETLIFGE